LRHHTATLYQILQRLRDKGHHSHCPIVTFQALGDAEEAQKSDIATKVLHDLIPRPGPVPQGSSHLPALPILIALAVTSVAS
jgi:hypothetical protein